MSAITWLETLDAGLAQAADRRKPVLLDFHNPG